MVHYLHVRVDKRPKYYSHQEYLTETQDSNQTIDQQRTKTKQTITKLLAESNLKTSDLESKFANWQTDLAKLDTKTKIQEFQRELEQAIKDKKQQGSGGSKNNGLSLPAKIAIGGGVAVVILGIWYLAKKKKRF